MANIIPKSRERQAQHWRSTVPIHDAAKLLPEMSDDELDAMGNDIKRRGLLVPLAFIREDGVEKLLDGIHRLSAMEMAGLEVIKDGELNPAIPRQVIPEGTDPYPYVLSVNLHRRHLTSEQRRDFVEKLIRAYVFKSNRSIAKLAKRDHKTVGTIREELEARGEIPHVKIHTDTKGREQPARRAKQKKEKRKLEAAPSQTKKKSLDDWCSDISFQITAARLELTKDERIELHHFLTAIIKDLTSDEALSDDDLSIPEFLRRDSTAEVRQ